jgi:hypothetical protein
VQCVVGVVGCRCGGLSVWWVVRVVLRGFAPLYSYRLTRLQSILYTHSQAI